LLLLGFLIAAQVSAQAPAAQYSSLERPDLIQTIQDLQKRHDDLAASIVATRSQLAAVREGGQGRQSDLVAINQALQQAQLAAGFTTIQGAGGYVYLSDGAPPPGIQANPADYRVDASDIRTIVNGLWRSGAEAIAINKERVVTSTAVVDVGGSILVNSAYVTDGTGQYVISVIGPSDMWTKLSSVDTFRSWMEQRYGPFHLAIQYVPDSKVLILGYAGTANLHLAQVSAAPTSTP
jgi:uncharacterized protein YlxW (UPF0749 family)